MWKTDDADDEDVDKTSTTLGFARAPWPQGFQFTPQVRAQGVGPPAQVLELKLPRFGVAW